MSVSGEGAALRSARKWLLLLCPEIPDQSGGKESVAIAIVVVEAAGYLAPTPAFGRRIAAFGRSLPSAAVDRGSRPSAAAAERGIEIDVATADPESMNEVVVHPQILARCNTPKFWPLY